MKALSGEMPLTLLPRDSFTKMVNLTRKFKVLINHNIIKWYTDNFKTSQGIGAEVAGPRTKLSISISRCVEINVQRNYRNESIAILSDSQAALKAISVYKTAE